MPDNITIHPNPSKGVINVKVEKQHYDVKVVSVEGKQIYAISNQQGSTKIDLSTDDKGIYFIKVTTIEGVSIQKIILE